MEYFNNLILKQSNQFLQEQYTSLKIQTLSPVSLIYNWSIIFMKHATNFLNTYYTFFLATYFTRINQVLLL